MLQNQKVKMTYNITSGSRVKLWIHGVFNADTDKDGIGVFVSTGYPFNQSLPTPSSVQSTDDAELEAARRAVQLARAKIPYQVNIFTESSYVLHNHRQFLSHDFRPLFQKISYESYEVKEARLLAAKGAKKKQNRCQLI